MGVLGQPIKFLLEFVTGGNQLTSSADCLGLDESDAVVVDWSAENI